MRILFSLNYTMTLFLGSQRAFKFSTVLLFHTTGDMNCSLLELFILSRVTDGDEFHQLRGNATEMKYFYVTLTLSIQLCNDCICCWSQRGDLSSSKAGTRSEKWRCISLAAACDKTQWAQPHPKRFQRSQF
mmetsp:Transcript_24959/g.34316  ORF Transcript_24959/g.34316 Transcript_24959/m.34316 type:complete len:131 (-) Transcript_24959:151-543(-)